MATVQFTILNENCNPSDMEGCEIETVKTTLNAMYIHMTNGQVFRLMKDEDVQSGIYIDEIAIL